MTDSLAAAADDDEDLLGADDNLDELLDLLGSFDVADTRLPSTSSSPVSPVQRDYHQPHHHLYNLYTPVLRASSSSQRNLKS